MMMLASQMLTSGYGCKVDTTKSEQLKEAAKLKWRELEEQARKERLLATQKRSATVANLEDVAA